MPHPLRMKPATSANSAIPVHVRIQNNKLSVDPDPVTLWKPDNQRIHWVCPEGTIEDITFTNPPPFGLDADSFTDKGDQHHVVTTPVVSSAVSGHHKYTITVKSHGKVLPPLDPIIRVMP